MNVSIQQGVCGKIGQAVSLLLDFFMCMVFTRSRVYA